MLENLSESDAFCNGVVVGLGLYRNKVITAHERREPIKIGENIYYIQDGRERLREAMDKICR